MGIARVHDLMRELSPEALAEIAKQMKAKRVEEMARKDLYEALERAAILAGISVQEAWEMVIDYTLLGVEIPPEFRRAVMAVKVWMGW